MKKIADFPQHFWNSVEKTEGCWFWKLSCRSYRNGLPRYGQVRVAGRNRSAHRVAWELAFGPIPDGFDVLHKCDNPACCRPDHLYLGDDFDNVRDKHERGRVNYQIRKAQLASRRLTLEQVREIRELIKNVPTKKLGRPMGGLPTNTLRGIARRYGVEHSTIRAIKNNQTWREI